MRYMPFMGPCLSVFSLHSNFEHGLDFFPDDLNLNSIIPLTSCKVCTEILLNLVMGLKVKVIMVARDAQFAIP